MPQTVTKYSFLLHICDSAFFFNIHYLSHFDYVLLCCIFSVWLIALSILSSKSIHFAANGDEQLSGWTTDILQNTSQSQSCTKKRSRSLFGGLLPIWSTTAFWIPVKLYIWEVCSANWWDAQKLQWLHPLLANRMGPVLLHDNTQLHITQLMLQNWKNLDTKFCHIQLTSH